MSRAVERERCDGGDVRLPAWSGLQRVARPQCHADCDGQIRGPLHSVDLPGITGLYPFLGHKTVIGREDHAVAEQAWIRRKYHGGGSQRRRVRDAVESGWGYFHLRGQAECRRDWRRLEGAGWLPGGCGTAARYCSRLLVPRVCGWASH